MFTLPYFQIYSSLFDMQLSLFTWCQGQSKPWKLSPWLFLVSFLIFFSILVFHIHFLRKLVPAEGQYLFPLSKPVLLEEPTLPLSEYMNFKKFSSLILNYWQPNLLCLFLSFVKLIKSVFKILFNLMKLFLCFHLSYLNLGESIKHNQIFG